MLKGAFWLKALFFVYFRPFSQFLSSQDFIQSKNNDSIMLKSLVQYFFVNF